MTKSQRPSQGPSATASISTTRGQAARMASMATTRGAACPRRVSRQLSQRRSGGVISRERRAWGSGNPGTRQPAAADISRDRRA